ncbi:hypothetical protein CHARACLAT_028805 [Characodon lateralis]|uniref:Uncharacterized protein n=1 Tax=Characodon lateralis TaxID=208331 RepID=A0ABU7DBE5_9TELE|nr:hypothetical protein [Characodon lateralis]
MPSAGLKVYCCFLHNFSRCHRAHLNKWSLVFLSNGNRMHTIPWDSFYLDKTNPGAYIGFGVDYSIPRKMVRCNPNSKPWVTSELTSFLNDKKRSCKYSDRIELKSEQKQNLTEGKQRHLQEEAGGET